jgi:hypothetical protein
LLTEQLLGDRMVQLLYHQVRENSSGLFRLLDQQLVITACWGGQF